MKTENLKIITVAAIKKKHLEQIRNIPYDLKTYKAIVADLMAERLVVRYWVLAPGWSTVMARVWLIEGPKEGELQLMIPPDEKDEYVAVCEKYKDIPQLFVD